MKAAEIRDVLLQMKTFAGLRDREMALLAAVMQAEDYAPGEVICAEGEPGRTCYFVVRGSIEVRKTIRGGADRVISVVRPDQVFGHIALVDQGPRSATCVALESTRVLALDHQDFETLFTSGTRFALLFQDVIARTVSQQLRAANDRLAVALAASPARQHSELRTTQELLAHADVSLPGAISA